MTDTRADDSVRMREYLIFAGVAIRTVKNTATITGREIHLKRVPSEKNEVHGGINKAPAAHITYYSIDMSK